MNRYEVGGLVTRDGTDVQRILYVQDDQHSMEVVCVRAPASGWCAVGDKEFNLCSRYSFSVITKCPECGEVLMSHAGRGWKYFHRHVVHGPYPNPKPHRCSLVDAAFERDGTAIHGSAEARLVFVRASHPKAEIHFTPNI